MSHWIACYMKFPESVSCLMQVNHLANVDKIEFIKPEVKWRAAITHHHVFVIQALLPSSSSFAGRTFLLQLFTCIYASVIRIVLSRTLINAAFKIFNGTGEGVSAWPLRSKIYFCEEDFLFPSKNRFKSAKCVLFVVFFCCFSSMM